MNLKVPSQMLSTEKTKGDVNRKIDGGKPGGWEGCVCVEGELLQKGQQWEQDRQKK